MTTELRHALAAFLAGALLASVAPKAEAKEVRYKDYPLDLKDIDRISLIGIHGNVRVTPAGVGRQAVMHVRKTISDKSTADDLSRFDGLSFEVRKEGQTLVIEAHTAEPKADPAATGKPLSKEAMENWFKPTAPELQFDLEAPSVPVEISMRNGQVVLNQLRQPAAVSLVTGSIHSVGSEGALRLQIQRGDLKIDKHQGSVNIDSYAAKVAASDVEGDVTLTNFSGDSNLSSVQGAIDLKSATGPSVVSKSTGAIDFFTGRGSINLAGFDGPIRGQSDLGSVSATVEGEAEIHIESNQGAVAVKLPSDSGASLKLQSDEGALSGPESLHAQAHAKSLAGRLSGEGPKGSVAIKTKSASVRVRI